MFYYFHCWIKLLVYNTTTLNNYFEDFQFDDSLCKMQIFTDILLNELNVFFNLYTRSFKSIFIHVSLYAIFFAVIKLAVIASSKDF